MKVTAGRTDFKEGKESKLIFYAHSTMKVTAGRTDFKEGKESKLIF